MARGVLPIFYNFGVLVRSLRGAPNILDSIRHDEIPRGMVSREGIFRHASPDKSGGTLSMEEIEQNWWLQRSERAIIRRKFVRSAVRFPAT